MGRTSSSRPRHVWTVLIAASLTGLAGLSLVAAQQLVQQDQQSRGVFAGADFSPRPPIRPLSPAEEAKQFILPPGYHLELVLAEPDIESPAAIAFDGNGRLYVAELRSYMLDADATNEEEPISRISMHESTKGDGHYDRHTVFIDKLVTPRMVTPLDGSILTMETDQDDIYQYRDTNGDGVADKKSLFFSGAGRRGNLEHQPSGFVWGMDNWIYSTYNAFRLRWTPTGVRTGPTAPNGGQWGLTQDDYGKMWFVDAGGERGPVNFQTPIHYGAFNVEDQFEPGFDVTWPIGPSISDMQGGMPRIRMPLGVLNHFTAACGQDIFRGDRLPADLRGDLLFAEPVGRLIRRSKIVVTEGLTQLRNAYPGSEFILNTDPLFRPVNMMTAPDGTLYIVDMYHGIVQESEWTKPGTYLRRKIEQYQLDKVTGHGRIWRLVYDGMTPNPERPRMLDETPAQLVAHLDHPNGWWRDMAQKLLVLRQDKSVAPALVEMTKASPSLLARFHAMWTLEGLGALDAALVREQLKDGNPDMRVQALRASESLYKAGDKSLEPDMRASLKDPDTKVVIQAMLTLHLLKVSDEATVIRDVQAVNKTRGVQEIGTQILKPPMSTFGGGGFRFLTAEQQQVMQRGAGIYAELCYACHGEDGKGAPMAGAPAGTKMAPPLAASIRVQGHRDYVIKTLLHGLNGPIEGNTFPGVMVPMGANTDDWVAAVGSYVRNAFGNRAPFITAADVAHARAATGNRQGTWTVEELETSLPVLLPPQPTWHATASHNVEAAPRALDHTRPVGWTTATPQQAGMWFQVELPEAVSLNEIQFESGVSFRESGPPPRPGAGASGRSASSGQPATPGQSAAPGQAAASGAAQSGAPGQSATPGQAAAASGRNAGQGTRPSSAAAALNIAVGFPRGYRLQVSMDGTTWSAPIAEGQGNGPTTAISFAPVRAKFVRITQTATVDNAPAWSIQRLRLYQPRPMTTAP